MSAVAAAYERAKRRLPSRLRDRVPHSLRRAVGARLGPSELRPWDPSARTAAADLLTTAEVTNAAFQRLADEDVQLLLDRLAPPQRALVEQASLEEQRRLIVSFGLDQRLPAFLEKVGYGDAVPPEDVHAMARGPMAVAGAYFYADMVVQALRDAGVEPWFASRALDFGCSSGRVVRALASVYPAVEWHGCDPNRGAIDWARDHLPHIAFEASPQHPPLAYSDAYFEFVFAISIWSHLGPDAALSWLDEMHRIIRPGGHLILTTHGYHSLSYYASEGSRPPAHLSRIGEALYREGFWYAAEFGEAGDWGVKDEQWGSAFLSLEWLAGKTRGRWHVVSFAAGRAAGNQDVIVLRREPGVQRIDPGARAHPRARAREHDVTDALFAKLDAADVDAVLARMDGEHRQLYEAGDEGERKAIVLALGLHHGVDAVGAKTGLSATEPPEDVHAMARGPLAAGGGYWYADLVVRALHAAGVKPGDARRGLDFGASSGRVLRPLALAYPDVEWHGCDPNGQAIEWAREHLAPIQFAVSPQEPPLSYPDHHFDFVYAISIWSHFAEEPALAWLAEMERVIRPGGHLILTTHGYGSLAYYARTGERTVEQLAEIERALYRDGFWYAPEFGEEGDWGVVNPDWGTAYLSMEWLLEHATPSWLVVDFGGAEVAANQDLVVLRRPAGG